jgi:arsenate reductase
MAEGIVNYALGDTWIAYSAGTNPAGYVHPLAIQVMDEINIDISQNESKSVNSYRETDFDVVITVCDGAARNCPVWLGKGRTVHIGFDDPADATGSTEERLQVFRRIRDEIKENILKFLQNEINRPSDFILNI